MKFNICTLSVLALCTISSAITIPRAAQDSIAEKNDRLVSSFLERAIQPTPATASSNIPSISTPTSTTISSPTTTPTGRTPIKDRQLGRVFMYVGIALGAFTVIAMLGGAIAGMRWMAQTKKSNDIHYRKVDETLHFLKQGGRSGRIEGYGIPPGREGYLMPPARLSKPPRVASRG